MLRGSLTLAFSYTPVAWDVPDPAAGSVQQDDDPAADSAPPAGVLSRLALKQAIIGKTIIF